MHKVYDYSLAQAKLAETRQAYDHLLFATLSRLLATPDQTQ